MSVGATRRLRIDGGLEYHLTAGSVLQFGNHYHQLLPEPADKPCGARIVLAVFADPVPDLAT